MISPDLAVHFLVVETGSLIPAPGEMPLNPSNAVNMLSNNDLSYPGGPASWGTGEVQTYTNRPSNVATNGQGNLVITAIKDAKGAWTSARIETKQTFMAPAGKKMRVQASLKLPNLGGGGIGYWPAFWTLGAAYRGNYW